MVTHVSQELQIWMSGKQAAAATDSSDDAV